VYGLFPRQPLFVSWLPLLHPSLFLSQALLPQSQTSQLCPPVLHQQSTPMKSAVRDAAPRGEVIVRVHAVAAVACGHFTPIVTTRQPIDATPQRIHMVDGLFMAYV
jgi:hypothetical protein